LCIFVTKHLQKSFINVRNIFFSCFFNICEFIDMFILLLVLLVDSFFYFSYNFKTLFVFSSCQITQLTEHNHHHLLFHHMDLFWLWCWWNVDVKVEDICCSIMKGFYQLKTNQQLNILWFVLSVLCSTFWNRHIYINISWLILFENQPAAFKKKTFIFFVWKFVPKYLIIYIKII
jgi:hypothetical protein